MELGSNSTAYRGKSAARRYIDRGSKRHSKRGGYREI